MKRILLLIFVLLSLSQAKASDTLTVRQIFNFNVGDTFDYSYNLHFSFLSGGGSFYSQTYARFVITGKTISPGNDSVTYIRQQIYPLNTSEVIVYTLLDSSEFQLLDTGLASPYATLDTATLADGRLTNAIGLNIPFAPTGYDATFGEGLGMTNANTGQSDGSTYDLEFDTTLIYYAKGTDAEGVPFYNDTPLNDAHFTPIPEECAFWNYGPAYNNGISSNTSYQITTGNKVFLNSHTYVELKLRSLVNDTLSMDSTVGFFRNDTLEQAVYFTLQPGSSESVLYNFAANNTKEIHGPPYIQTKVYAGRIGGISRAEWSFSFLSTNGIFNNLTVSNMLEGIGALNGFFYSPGSCEYDGDGFEVYSSCSPSLQSFCVCGETLYPDTVSGQCALLTGLPNLSSNNLKINLYPNPTSGNLHLSISAMDGSDYHLILTDILGQQVYSAPVTQSERTFDISKLSTGIYTWRLEANEGIIKTGKFVKE